MAAIRQRGRRRDRRGHDQLLQPRWDAEILIRLLLLAATLLAAPSAQAQEGRAYVGGALGQAKFNEWCDTAGGALSFASCEDTDTAWKLFGGYRFNPYIGIEASYINWGTVTASGTLVDTGASFAISAKQRSYGAAAVAALPLGGEFEVFGKFGFLRNEQQTRNQTRTVDRDDSGVHYGIGARYAFRRGWAVRGEWENTEKLEVQLLSIGVEYRL